MNLDDVMGAWRSHDLSPLFGVDKTLLHQVLRQEQARTEERLRRIRWFMNVVTVFLFITAALFLAIMIDPKDDDVLVVWDYVVGIVGVAAAIVLAGALSALRRSRRVREQGFDDSFRDHLRRHISQLDDESAGERRLALIVVAATLVCGTAISIAGHRINDVPWGEFDWSPFPSVLILLFTSLLLFRWVPRARRRNVGRKRQLEALLKELDGQ
jgi:peptidoglycan/LPS O-acetylase OafA/YrhL